MGAMPLHLFGNIQFYFYHLGKFFSFQQLILFLFRHAVKDIFMIHFRVFNLLHCFSLSLLLLFILFCQFYSRSVKFITIYC